MQDSQWISKLLASPSLRSGVNQVRDFGKRELAGIQVQVLLAKSDSLGGRIDELLVLDCGNSGQSSSPTPQELSALLAPLAASYKASHVLYISGGIAEPILSESSTPQVQLLAPCLLFEYPLSIA